MRVATRRPPGPDARNRVYRPQAEGLEDRMLLYGTLGDQWVHGDRITYSFVPDGTSVGGIPSVWFQSMADRGISEQVWKDEFRKAAATWQLYADINLVEVYDNGAAFSVAGNQQNDSRFGDIRIAGIPMGGSTLGATYAPPPDNGGTLAGDIMMNSAAAWNVNRTYDIRTVALHEIGHALGMGHSTISSAVMYDYHNGTKQAPTSDDIAGIQSIYGGRPPDAFDASASNQPSPYATNITPYLDAAKQVRLWPLDITASADVDWYQVTAPAGSGYWLTVAVQSEYLSSLSPTVVIYNNALQAVAAATAPNSYGETVVAHAPAVVPGQRYYIQAQAVNGGPLGSGGPSSNGSYALLVNFGTQTLYLVPPPNTTVLEQPNQGFGSMSLTDLQLQLETALDGLNPGMRKQVERAIASVADADGWVDPLVLAANFRPILDSLNPAARRKLEAALGSMDHIIQIGDLIGYGSVLTTADLGLVDGTAQADDRAGAPRLRSVAWSLGSPGDDVLVVLTGEEMDLDLASLVGRGRARDRVATWAVDRALDSWDRG